jgi:hypothetical protein
LTEAAAALDYFAESFPGWTRNRFLSPIGTDVDHLPKVKDRIPLTEFIADGHHLIPKRPVEVTLVRDEDCYLAQSERFNVFAAGETREEAIQDFTQQVVYFYLHYRERPAESLIGLALRLKPLYASSFDER